MKGAIIYKGKYGATQQYAAWLGESLEMPVLKTGEISGPVLRDYDFFILGTSVYIGKLQLTKWLRRNAVFLQNKKIFLFQVAGTPPDEKEKRESYNKAGIPTTIHAACESFFLPGKMIFRELSWTDRWLLKMGARLAKNPDAGKNMLMEYDSVRREHITAILSSVHQFLERAGTGKNVLQTS